VLDAHPLDEGHALAHRGERGDLADRGHQGVQRPGGGPVQPEPLGLGGGHREALACPGQRVGHWDRRRGTVEELGGDRVETVGDDEIGEHGGPGARRPAGQPPAVLRAPVAVHRAGRVAQQRLADPLEHHGGAQHHVPAPGSHRPGADLGGATVGHPGQHRGARSQPGGRGHLRAETPERCAGQHHRRERLRVDAERGEHLGRPSQLGDVVPGLEGGAGVGGGARLAGEPRGDDIGLVRDPGLRVVVEQGQQGGQCPRRADPVPQPRP